MLVERLLRIRMLLNVDLGLTCYGQCEVVRVDQVPYD
jgi:hypothetical protein